MEFRLDTDSNGSIVIRSNYKSDIASILDNKGKIIVTNDGSNFNSMIEISISLAELDRLASLDYSNTNSEAMTSILNDKNDNKIETEDAPNIDPLPHFNFDPVAHRNFDPLPHIYLDPVAHRNFDPYFLE